MNAEQMALEQRFSDIVLHYVVNQSEEALAAAADIGRQAVQDGMPVEQMAEIFEAALTKLSVLHPNWTLKDVSQIIAPPLAEVLMGFGLAFREHQARREAESMRRRDMIDGLARLSGGLAHEINNLLQPIIGCAEMALEDAADNSELNESLRMILDCSSKARDIVRTFLALSRRESAVMTQLDLRLILKRCRAFLRQVLSPSIILEFCCPDEPIVVNANENQLNQIIMNLATNAADAMNQNGVIELTVKIIHLDDFAAAMLDLPSGDYANIRCRDNGCGMSQSVLDHVFEAFFTTKQHGQGTGLGLAVVYSIVREWHGGINIESVPDVGTIVSIFIPLVH
ncbi:putative Histidine kinase [Azospirillaceae bacterium]